MSNLSPPLIATVADILGSFYSHSEIDTLFTRCRAPIPAPGGNKVDKVTAWLRAANADREIDVYVLLGCVLENFMEIHTSDPQWLKQRTDLERILADYGLSYQTGGRVHGGSTGTPTRTLESIIHDRDLATINTEFERALQTVETDPGQAVTAACAILEATCKVYIQDHHLSLPADQTLKPLWNVLRLHLTPILSPDTTSLEGRDMLTIIGGMTAAINGVGDLRTHAGSAHGRGRNSFQLEPKHARLAINAAHTVVGFVIETALQ